MWPAIIAAGAAIASGVIAANASADSAAAAQQASQWNAANQLAAGQQTASLQMMSATFNAGLAMQQGQINAQAQMDVANYNSSLIAETTAYNNSILETQAASEWDAYELDSEVMEMNFRTMEGDVASAQSASGTTMHVGSNADVLIDMDTRHMMDQTILLHNAEQVAADYTNAMARNSWEGESTRQKIIYEAEVGEYTTMANAQYAAAGSMMQGYMDSSLTKINTSAGAQSTIYAGNTTASQYESQAAQQIVGGFLQGASIYAGSYSSPSNPTTQFSQSTRTAPYTINYQQTSDSLLVA